MSGAEQQSDPPFRLTPDHRMLLRMRDTLYEGSWADFVRDLEARLRDEPHVFELVPRSPQMKSIITNHLGLIRDMRIWEESRGEPLRALEDTPDAGRP